MDLAEAVKDLNAAKRQVTKLRAAQKKAETEKEIASVVAISIQGLIVKFKSVVPRWRGFVSSLTP